MRQLIPSAAKKKKKRKTERGERIWLMFSDSKMIFLMLFLFLKIIFICNHQGKDHRVNSGVLELWET